MQKRIRAQQKIKMRIGPVKFLLEMPHRFHRVIHFAARMPRPRLGKRGDKSRMIRASEGHHRVAVGIGRHSAAMLVRWTARGNEVNFVQMKAALRGTRDCQVANMDRIKRAAKQRNPAYAWAHGGSAGALRRGGTPPWSRRAAAQSQGNAGVL